MQLDDYVTAKLLTCECMRLCSAICNYEQLASNWIVLLQKIIMKNDVCTSATLQLHQSGADGTT
jgi:hypothetical protein